MPTLSKIGFLTCYLLLLTGFSKAEEAVVVKRTSVANPVTDSQVFGAGEKTLLPSIFLVTHNETGQSLYWSPDACRLIAVKNGEGMNYRELIAEGIHPFARSLGSMGKPKFFGLRIRSGGNPEFLYTYGQLSIEERFEFSADGKKLRQHFTINSGAITGAVVVPEAWREFVETSLGRWEKTQLSLTRDEMKTGLTLTYLLDPSLEKTVAEN